MEITIKQKSSSFWHIKNGRMIIYKVKKIGETFYFCNKRNEPKVHTYYCTIKDIAEQAKIELNKISKDLN